MSAADSDRKPALAALTAAACTLAMTGGTSAALVDDVTKPGDTITSPNIWNTHPSSVIDNDANTKLFINDVTLGGQTAASFTVTVETAAVLTGFAITTANDAPWRNPLSVTIRGSNDGVDWTDIVVDMALPDLEQSASPPPLTEFEYAFTSLTSEYFTMFEVTFPTQIHGTQFQVGDVRLPGELIPEPASFVLLGIGGLLAGVRRRPRLMW